MSPEIAALRARSLPQVRARNRADRAVRARLRAEGVNLERLPVDKAEPFTSGGHGTPSRRVQHFRDGEEPCLECQAAEHAYRYPQGAERPFGWKLERKSS